MTNIIVTVYDPQFSYAIVCEIECISYAEAAIFEDEYTRAGFMVEVS